MLFKHISKFQGVLSVFCYVLKCLVVQIQREKTLREEATVRVEASAGEPSKSGQYSFFKIILGKYQCDNFFLLRMQHVFCL